jgi:hypothetical protein
MPDIPAVRQAKQARQTSEVVQGARNALATLLQDVGGEHGRGKIAMPKPWLNGADVGATVAQVCGAGMAKGLGADGLRQTGTADGHRDGLVDDAGGNVMAGDDTGTRSYGEIPGGEDLRPDPCLGDMRSLPSQRMGQVDLAMPLSRILLMPRPDPGQVVLEQRGKRVGNGGESVFVVPVRTNGQWLHWSIDVLAPEPDRIHATQPTPVRTPSRSSGE